MSGCPDKCKNKSCCTFEYKPIEKVEENIEAHQHNRADDGKAPHSQIHAALPRTVNCSLLGHRPPVLYLCADA